MLNIDVFKSITAKPKLYGKLKGNYPINLGVQNTVFEALEDIGVAGAKVISDKISVHHSTVGLALKVLPEEDRIRVVERIVEGRRRYRTFEVKK